ncbi:collagenase [Carboxylicivirga mesophila]|uniref:Collagenase n=1 Tax=Carboxylicivirga mesophila TaxID=1166478 RepID=A0ABS5KD14_9BACT|nr:collagenase [Carboxylicivirga mesophila]MBS2212722.1 collagenase [Carboxylicivirga mesophila]
MKRILIKFIVTLISLLVVFFATYAILFFNPSLSYSNKTQLGQVTIYHNLELEEKTSDIINAAIELTKSSELYDESMPIKLCFNDDNIYPHLYPMDSTPAFALSNAVILKKGDYQFNKNLVVVYYEENDFYQHLDLTWLLAHEFTHSLQFNADLDYMKKTTRGKINWKVEGYAEYISRNYKGDGRLKEKIDDYLVKSKNGQDPVKIIVDNDGTKQVHSYNKYGLMVQYLMEVKDMDYFKICEFEISRDQVFLEMMEWRNKY